MAVLPVGSNDQYIPYPVVFSPVHQAQSIQNNSFSVVERASPEKCNVSPWMQKGSRCSYVDEGELKEIVSNRSKLTPEQVNYYSTPQGIVDLNKKGISLALEKRVALFFQQSILCYNMSDFVFSAKGADYQVGSSPGLKFASSNHHFTIHQREGAHSSTIPTLIAHARDGSTPEGFVYLKGGTSYYQHQATIGMHISVNGADELIDGNGHDGKLRDVTVRILNMVAQGLDPVKATKKFCKALDVEIQRNLGALPAQDARAMVLERYHHKVTKIKLSTRDQALYDRLLGVIIDSANPNEQVLREVIYKKRYDVIRLQEVVESRIARRIEEAKMQMGSRERSYLEYMILKSFWETSESRIIEKLLSKTVAYFEQSYPSCSEDLQGFKLQTLRSFRTRVNNLQNKYGTLISNLMSDLRADFRELRCAEQSYRSGVFKDLRTKVNRWTQKEFCTQYQTTIGSRVSQSWVSRMENLSRMPTKATYSTPINQRRRFVTIADAERCSQTFGVDPGIFFPSLFTS